MGQTNHQSMDRGPDFPHFVAQNAYGRYCIPDAFRNREVPDLLASGGIYEPETLGFLQRALTETGGDIVTGGAFVGDFFPALSAALAPDARIHSFEPAPLTHAAARHTITLNGLTAVHLSQVAVGAHEGILPLQVERRKGGAPLAAAARIMPGSQGRHVKMVKVVRLDDLIPRDRRVTILHLDIEGFELEALHGATDLIARNRPILVLEAGRPAIRRSYLAYLCETFPEIGYHDGGGTEGNLIVLPRG